MRSIRAHARDVGAVVLLLVMSAGCSPGQGPNSSPAETKDKGGGAAQVTVTPKGPAMAGKPVRVAVTNGHLISVKVNVRGGGGLTGRVLSSGTRWVSDRRTTPGMSYEVEAVARAEDGARDITRTSFTTPKPDLVNKVDWRPGGGATVGIAQPVSLVFDRHVTHRALVEKQLKITTSNGTEGSWGWLKDWSGADRIDWRPRTYWRPGTKVILRADLSGIHSGASGGWFIRDYTTTFTVGVAQVVKVDLDSHKLTLVRDGNAVRKIPVSGGTPGRDTRSWRGTAVVLAKEGTVRMNSETVGLGQTYDRMVRFSMRLTWSGMYAHAAPWNAASFGRANRSHGCLGMSDADAEWLYRRVQPGDPFEIEGEDTKGMVPPGNGFGEWNLSWAEWHRRSALH